MLFSNNEKTSAIAEVFFVFVGTTAGSSYFLGEIMSILHFVNY